MRVFLERTTLTPQLSNVRCNSCGRDVEKEDPGYFEDHISLTKSWGYHSPYDGETHDIDLCVDCYQGWVNQFEIPPYVTCCFTGTRE
ncbi:MAG: hypothetical protein FWB96_11975 [Defluviitaleaceae bacterium]|nr:hypothetical protein [Defluviitaleaceae bacterium]MCL2263794.1 hypothetical protein [Defluviitaleaceae bacterium]